MPGTRTAPAVDGTPVRTEVSVRFIDHTGNKKSISVYDLGATVVAAEIQDFVAKLQACSNASIYEVNVTSSYSSAFQASNALEAVYENVANHITVLTKDATGRAQSLVVPSTIDTMLIAGSNNPDSANTTLSDFVVAGLELINGGALGSGTYTAVQSRFNSVKQINPATPWT
jgi:hypothetical protein